MGAEGEHRATAIDRFLCSVQRPQNSTAEAEAARCTVHRKIRGGKTVDVGLLKLKLMGRAKPTAGCSACLLTYLYSSACLPD